ncbi:MAG: hypothetical protein ACRD63_00510 [Pyrinomonadaceae bacterium]
MESTRALLQTVAGVRELKPPDTLIHKIRNSLITEAAMMRLQTVSSTPWHKKFTQWLEPRLGPTVVGTFASMVLFFSLASGLMPYAFEWRHWAETNGIMQSGLASNLVWERWSQDINIYDDSVPITPAGYAASREAFSSESPSIDPRGALAVYMSPERPNTGRVVKDGSSDSMLVVANVFSNGNASLTDIVKPPHNRDMINDVLRALSQGPAFVPAYLDHRPPTMRVVLTIERINVREQSF